MAAYYYRLAADSGDTNSMLTYASMNANGDGIATNKKEAEKYYRIASNQDDLCSNEIYQKITKYTKFSL